MFKKILSVALFLMILVLSSKAQDGTNDQAMMLAQPGPEHELLKKLSGDWILKFKYDMGNNMKMDGKGIGSGKMILGGRFLNVESTTEAMGMKAASISILGYDRRTNKYTIWGIDEMGTYSISAEGDYDANTKKITLKGSVLDPTGLTKDMQDYRFVYDLSKDNEIKIDLIFAKPDKSDWLLMEMWMTKK